MQFIAKLTHSPDNCWARDEHEGKASELKDRLANAEDAYGVSILGAYVAANEHTFHLILESDSFEAITGLLGPPLLQDHNADVIPVTTIEEAMDATDVQ
jgi:hypothetical protein